MAQHARDSAIPAAAARHRSESWGARQAKKEPDFDIPISMVDVVFLLLIFFMCTAKFRTQERKMDIDLPNAGPGKGPLDPPTVMVYLKYRSNQDTSGICNWRGLKVEVNQKDVGYDKAGLRSLYGLLRNLAATGTEKPVHIFATRNCPFMYVVAAVDNCKRLGFSKLQFTLPLRRKGGGSDFWHLE